MRISRDHVYLRIFWRRSGLSAVAQSPQKSHSKVGFLPYFGSVTQSFAPYLYLFLDALMLRGCVFEMCNFAFDQGKSQSNFLILSLIALTMFSRQSRKFKSTVWNCVTCFLYWWRKVKNYLLFDKLFDAIINQINFICAQKVLTLKINNWAELRETILL